MSRIQSKISPENRENSSTPFNSTGVGFHEMKIRFQGQIDDIIKELYVGIGFPAAAGIQNLLSIAMHSPDKSWSIEDPIMELLFIWYPALSCSIKVALLQFLNIALVSNSLIVSHAMPMKIVQENIKNFNLSGETAHESQYSLELLAASINLGVVLAQDANSFVHGIKETIISFLSPFMLHEGSHELAAKTLKCLKPHLVAYRDTYASEAIPLLIAGIDETVEAWQLKERGELIAMLATSSTAEMIVDCLGGLPTLMSSNHSQGSVAIIYALASRLEQLPESANLMSVLSGLLCSQIQSLIDLDSSISNLESGILVTYQALVRGSAPLVLSMPVLDQLSSLLIQIGNHGHHVAFLHSKVPEALPFYLSLVGRYARNDPSLTAHLEQLLAAGGLDIVIRSDVLPLLAARFPGGPYNTLLSRFIESTKENVSCIKLQLFEGLMDLRSDLLENAFKKYPEHVNSSHVEKMHLNLRLPSIDFDLKLSPDSYPAPNPAQFLYLWNKYPVRFSSSLLPFKGSKESSNPKVRVSTVTTDSPSGNSPYQQWNGYTFESDRQVLILLIYRFRTKSDSPPELIVKSDSELPACLLMEFTLFFRTLSAA